MEAVFVSLAVFAVLAIVLVLYLAATNHQKAQDAIKKLTGIVPTSQADLNYKKIHSTLGFELTINDRLQNTEAILAGPDKVVKSGSETFAPDSYVTINVYPDTTGQIATSQADMGLESITYLSAQTSSKKTIIDDLKAQYGSNIEDFKLLDKYYAPVSDQNKTYTLTKSEEVTVGGNKFLKNSYEIINNQPIKYKTYQTDYLTVQNGRPYKITIYQNLGSKTTDLSAFNTILDSLKFYPLENSASLTNLNNKPDKPTQQASSILNGFIAHASSHPLSKDPAIQVVAKNMPAVVRIASTNCIDYELALGTAKQSFTGGCSGAFGSGFIISPDGYVVTNGHVVHSSAVDVLRANIMFGNLATIKSYLGFLVKTTFVTQDSADAFYARVVRNDDTALQPILNSLEWQELEETSITETKQASFYAVQLSNQVVIFDEKNLQNFNYGSTIVRAELIAKDYDPNMTDEGGFRGSDVAILKIDERKNYPFVTLGSIDGLGAGSPLTVIGFPGVAESSVVDEKQSIPTATLGQVSAIRDAKGTTNKLIQSDVAIGRGNSGGPAFNQYGEVVGLATYTVSENTSGGGAKVNYMRDIADLKALLKKNHIILPATAEGNQKLWEQGLEKFSNAYYSSAIADFRKLKAQYPAHRLVDSFIARAETAKKDGKEATPPEVYITIVIVVIVVIIIPGIILFFVIRHHRGRKGAHEAYMQQPGGMPTMAQQSSVAPIAPPLGPTAINTPPQSDIQPRIVDMLGTPPAQPTSPQDQDNQPPPPPPMP